MQYIFDHHHFFLAYSAVLKHFLFFLSLICFRVAPIFQTSFNWIILAIFWYNFKDELQVLLISFSLYVHTKPQKKDRNNLLPNSLYWFPILYFFFFFFFLVVYWHLTTVVRFSKKKKKKHGKKERHIFFFVFKLKMPKKKIIAFKF